MNRSIGKLIVLFAVAVVVLFVVAFIFSSPSSPPPLVVLPNPNGYDSFVRAGSMVVGNSADLATMNEVQLEQLMQDNSNALQIVRAGLQEESWVPIQFSQAYTEQHLPDLAHMKRLAQTLEAEGKLLELKNRPDEAARVYLEIVQFGSKSMRGGLLIDGLVGIAMQNIGAAGLENLTNKLDAEFSRNTTQTLTALDLASESWDQIMQNDREWSQRSFPLYRVYSLFYWRSLKAAQAKVEHTYKQHEAKIHRLVLSFATRAYELEKGRPPKSNDDLVPDYLKAIPQEP